ncbi:MAG TPA: MBOAT family O-acyltransferase [Candidatus Melainabacteria bacterium]|nr:MBOAT family O-acyltransferase [Candidatus Melainabacteria bacterium]
MLFNSFEYLVFLPVVVLAYWLVPRQVKPVFLIAASYFFYMYSFKVYGLLLLGLTAANYVLGLLVSRFERLDARRLILVAGIALNLSTLALFKYTNFILDSINTSCAWLGRFMAFPLDKGVGISDLPIILPLGISFFVFEFIHYLVDIYKGSKPVKNPLRFALFASFFPSQIAGPIKRYQDFDKQLDEKPQVTFDQFSSGLFLISQGLFKKTALGDNLAPVVKAGFDNPNLMGTFEGWLCITAFAFQIYYDFSGYTDIGRGSAKLLGYSLPENFNMPYIASSLREFWHRWHMSLSTWLRDYLFIPLGGSRGREAQTYANLITTMLLGGLWHGASWTFVLWGLFHGVGLAINRAWDKKLQNAPALSRAVNSVFGLTLAHAITLVTVLCGWVLFRAKTVPEAIGVFKAMFTPCAAQVDCEVANAFFNSPVPAAICVYFFIVGGAAVVKLMERNAEDSYDSAQDLPGLDLKSFANTRWHFAMMPLPAMAHIGFSFFIGLVLLAFCRGESQPFIYFQF